MGLGVPGIERNRVRLSRYFEERWGLGLPGIERPCGSGFPGIERNRVRG
jgi:hypothetical protein